MKLEQNNEAFSLLALHFWYPWKLPLPRLQSFKRGLLKLATLEKASAAAMENAGFPLIPLKHLDWFPILHVTRCTTNPRQGRPLKKKKEKEKERHASEKLTDIF